MSSGRHAYRLPEEPGAAQAALHEAATRLRADEQALATVERRLLQVASGAVSFSTLMPQPEQTLLRLLATVEPASGASFGLRDEIQERWQAAQDQLAALSAQACEALGAYATRNDSGCAPDRPYPNQLAR
ncbi:hypothetical protein [Chloroflexus sp.]|uniref:hypothetical protein n=1 Tax=Chloroflexus sp. TaxID=1904827 RepID=UPI00404AB33C